MSGPTSPNAESRRQDKGMVLPDGYLASRGAGAGVGLVVSIAASLIVEAARDADEHWEDARGAASQAAVLRDRSLRLAEANAEVFATARGALATATEEKMEKDERERQIADLHLGKALTHAAEIPLRIAEAALDVAELAALVAADGADDARPDAIGASLLAAGAAAAAGHLVDVNLTTHPDGEQSLRAREVVRLAQEVSERAQAARP